MKKINARLLANNKIADTLYQMDFSIEKSTVPLPGQFLTVKISDTYTPLLRRPFAFSSYNDANNTASVIYQVRGQGTQLLSRLTTDTPLDIIAPLGNQFPLPQKDAAVFLVAGGIGLGPILFLASHLKKLNIPCTLIFGCKSAPFIPANVLSPFTSVICTDDGTSGFHGTVTDYITSQPIPENSIIYCCGPHPMLRACHNVANTHSIPCIVSVEQTMACGVGACMGCVVKVTGPQKFVRACKEGPVFNSKDIVWE